MPGVHRDQAAVGPAALLPAGGHTGGLLIEFLEPRPGGDGLRIRWRVRRPAPEAHVTQALAQPWKVKVFPRPRGAVKVEQGAD
jgi:hypothetical protein